MISGRRSSVWPSRTSTTMAARSISPDFATKPANSGSSSRGRLSTAWKPRSSKLFSADAFPEPEIPVRITSSFAGFLLTLRFAAARLWPVRATDFRTVMRSSYTEWSRRILAFTSIPRHQGYAAISDKLLGNFNQFHLPIAPAMQHIEVSCAITEYQQIAVAKLRVLHSFLDRHRLHGKRLTTR